MSYQLRTKTLSALGFATYNDYLASPLWSVVKSAVLSRDYCACLAKDCRNGGSLPKQVHHLDYARLTLLGLDCGKLVTLCSECHYRVEYTRNGRKLSLAESRKKTLKLIRRQGLTRLANLLVTKRILTRLRAAHPEAYKVITAEIPTTLRKRLGV